VAGLNLQKRLAEESSDTRAHLDLLGRVLASVQLRRSARLRELLLYIGQRSLVDNCDQLHEQEIGCRVFGRPEGYDTSVDTIVRVNATELRKRVDAYFESEGLHESLIMEIPRGSYIPVFRPRSIDAQTTTEPQASPPVNGHISDSPDVNPADHPVAGDRPWMFPALIASGLIALALAGGCIALWFQNRASHQSLVEMQQSCYPWKYQPTLSAFWTDFFGTHPNADVVMSDAFFKLTQDLTKKPLTLNDYLSSNYTDQLFAQEKSPELSRVLHKVATWRSSNGNHLKLAQRIMALDPLGKSIHLYYARDYTPEQLERDNTILLGSRLTNPWVGLIDGRMNFIAKFDSNDITAFTNRTRTAGEQESYDRTGSFGYCVVAYLPNPSNDSKILIIEGTSVQATEAGGDFLLSEGRLSAFQKMLHVSRFPYFEVLLKTSELKSTPFTATIEAYRAYPNLH
jgi:hypothetical protein